MIDIVYHLSLPPGTLIEEYRIASVLGQGSFGITYLAEDINLGTQVAIKEYLPGEWAFRDSTQTVRPKSTSVSESFERGQEAFLKEARLLARVAHPNIVKVRRFFRAHGTAYIAMDFIKGKSLGDTLGTDYPAGGYPSALLTRVLISVLGGLGALHEAGIIHRDIKPGNIVIEPGGNPILVDFGAARNFDSNTQGMTVIVTPGYAPIEQYSDEREQGPFTDIYALGALAYRAVTGQAPDAPYKRLGSTTSISASAAGAGRYPTNVLSAVDWALAVQPQDRPQTAAALLARLRDVPAFSTRPMDEPTQILDERTRIIETPHRRELKDSVAVTKTPTLPGKTGPVAAPARRNLRTLIVASIAVLVLAGLGAAYLSAPSKPVDANAVARQAEERRAAQQAAEAEAAAAKLKAEQEAREEAARQAAAAAEAERQAVAAQAKAEQEAAEKKRRDAEREAAAKVEAERQAAAAAAKEEADRQAAAAAKAEADRQAAAATAKAEADRRAAAAAAKAEADRQAAAAAAKAEADRQAAAAAAAKRASTNQVVKTSPPPRVADSRCTTILQSAQMGALSDEDKAYLRDNCH